MGIWNHRGVVLAPGEGDGGNLWEPSVIREGSPQILTDLPTVWKMWFCSGWGATAGTINYAEASEAVGPWTRHPTPVLTGYYRSFVRREGSVLEMYAADFAASRINKLESVDGITWTFVETVVEALGSAPELAIHNSSVYKEDGVEYMLYDQQNAVGFTTGLMVKSSGSWVRHGTVMSFPGGTVGGPSPVEKINGLYYVWMIRSPQATGVLPSEIYRYSALAMTGLWTPLPTPSVPRITDDEGPNSPKGQAADPCFVYDNGTCYMFYCASKDGSQASGDTRLKLLTVDMTREQLVLTNEGINLASIQVLPIFTPLPYRNNWVGYNVATNSVGYHLDNSGYVNLQGLVKGGIINKPITALLPAGRRPGKTTVFNPIGNGQVNIGTDGSITAVQGSNLCVSLDGIRFAAEQ